jgi:DNA-binding GntR family transcriptional regulator
MNKILRYRFVQNILKQGIQKGMYPIGSYLPSEHELCRSYSITRTTARKALDELQREGFIDRIHGKGSIVKARRESLGLLQVKGFTEAVGHNVNTRFICPPAFSSWPTQLPLPVSDLEQSMHCIFFERLRSVGQHPVMIEKNWFAGDMVPNLLQHEFVDHSFFKTLSQIFFIEITGSEQELRALSADQEQAALLNMEVGSPVLVISIKFSTNNPKFNIYSELACNTSLYPIGNAYFI